MAHKTAEAAVRDIAAQQVMLGGGYAAIIVWHKDWERWQTEMIATLDRTRYDLILPPETLTRSQLVFGRKKKA